MKVQVPLPVKLNSLYYKELYQLKIASVSSVLANGELI